MQERQDVWVRPLGREGSLEEGMATHSSTLAWKIPRSEDPGKFQSTGLQRSRTGLATKYTHWAFSHQKEKERGKKRENKRGHAWEENTFKSSTQFCPEPTQRVWVLEGAGLGNITCLSFGGFSSHRPSQSLDCLGPNPSLIYQAGRP